MFSDKSTSNIVVKEELFCVHVRFGTNRTSRFVIAINEHQVPFRRGQF